MRYLFNSFSLPDHDIAGLLAAAHRFGYSGLELRTDKGHAHGVEVSSDSDVRRRAAAQIVSSGLSVDCLCLPTEIADPDAAAAVLAQVQSGVDLASDVGIPFVRVFGGEFPDVIARATARQHVVDILTRLADHASTRDVVVCLETHDRWADPGELRRVMTRVDHPHAGLLWDVWQTGRRAGASLADSYHTLSPWIRHVQMHDGLLRIDRLEFRPIGRGDIDHLEVLALLRGGGYQGAIAGEWIDWEPGEVHLPRELAQMHHYEALLNSVHGSAVRSRTSA